MSSHLSWIISYKDAEKHEFFLSRTDESQIPNPLELTTTPNDTLDYSALTELQPPQITQLNKEPIIPIESQPELPLESQILCQEDFPDNSMIPDDPPLESPPPNENAELSELALDNY